VLPPLKDVASAMLHEPRFFTHCAVTFGEALVGFVVGNSIALIVAAFIVRWRSLEASLMPYAIALKTTPVVAIAPILIIWFGGGWLAKAVAAASVCFFPTLVNAVRGLRLVDAPEYKEYSDLFACWGIGWWKTLWHLRAPFALPLIFSAFKVSSSLALVGAIVGEFIAADVGLGYLVVIYSRRLETASMFAAVFASTAIGVLWFYATVLIERQLSKRFGTLTAKDELL
jgi:NitT/TauT family transport system permease protein